MGHGFGFSQVLYGMELWSNRVITSPFFTIFPQLVINKVLSYFYLILSIFYLILAYLILSNPILSFLTSIKAPLDPHISSILRDGVKAPLDPHFFSILRDGVKQSSSIFSFVLWENVFSVIQTCHLFDVSVYYYVFNHLPPSICFLLPSPVLCFHWPVSDMSFSLKKKMMLGKFTVRVEVSQALWITPLSSCQSCPVSCCSRLRKTCFPNRAPCSCLRSLFLCYIITVNGQV